MIIVLLPVSLLAATIAVLDRYSLESDSMTQWRLPDRLNEISGLAMTPDGRLLAVDDEIAVIYEIDYDNGKLVKAFALGKPVIKGDFEGIAVADGLVYLTTSSGRVYLFAEGADGQRVTFDNYDSELGAYCEIEGLVQSIDGSRLYFLCKKPRKNSEVRSLNLFAWDIAKRELLPDESIVLPEEKIMRQLRIDRFSPSGVTIDRQTGNRIIVASRQRVLAEITKDGKLVATRHLGPQHKQAEGIEMAIDGRLVIADEGRSHRARLAVYEQDRDDVKNND